MLTAILATWLSIAGVPNLKEWQTLLSACIAFGGGAFAYKAAMLRIDFDRDQAEALSRRERDGAILRLQTSLLALRKNARDAKAFIESQPQRKTLGMPINGLGPLESINLEEAWQNLHLFPRDVAFMIANIRLNISGLDSAVKKHKDAHIIPAHVDALFEMFDRIDDQSRAILAWIINDLGN